MKLKDINWLNHGIELVIVILGISIAFSLNKMAENRKENQRQVDYLESFLDEVLTDIPKMDTAIAKAGEINYSLEKLVAILDGKQEKSDSLHTFIGLGLYSIYVEQINQTTFKSMQSSGNLDIIENLDLRKELVKYYSSIETLEFLTDWDFKHHNEQVLGYLPYYLKAEKSELLADAKLRAITEIKRFISNASQNSYAEVKALAVCLKQELEQEIKRLD